MSQKSTLLGCCLVFCTVVDQASAAGKNPYPRPSSPLYTLVEDGKAQCGVVLSESSSPIEALAARELVAYFRKITGVQLTVINRADGVLCPIYLGKAALNRLGHPKNQRLGTDGFVLKSNPDGIFIAGEQDLGTLYGTYQFIEKHLGVRWFMPGQLDEVVPATRTLQGLRGSYLRWILAFLGRQGGRRLDWRFR